MRSMNSIRSLFTAETQRTLRPRRGEEGQRDRGTEGQGDKETRRREDRETSIMSPHPLVFLSPLLPVSPSPPLSSPLRGLRVLCASVVSLLFLSSCLAPLVANAQSGEITGRVVTEDGTGLPNVMLFLAPVAREARVTISPSQNQTSSDEDGNFKFTGVAQGAYFVNVSIAKGYIRKTAPVSEDQPPVYYHPGDNVTITMIKGGVITGRVTNMAGEPLMGAQVSAAMVRNANGKAVLTGMAGGRPRYTDDRGVYRIYGLPPGSYIVFTRTTSSGSYPTPYDGDVPTYHPSSLRDTAAEVTVASGSEAGGIDIRHRGDRGRVISGVVSSTGAESPSAVSVMLFDAKAEALSGSNYIQPGAKGFAFEGLPDGEYILSARINNQENSLASAPRRLSLSGKDISGIDLKLLPLGSISGAIVVENLPEACGEKRKIQLDQLSAFATRDDLPKDAPAFLPGRSSSSRGASEKGEFTINNVEPGHFQIRMSLPDENIYLKAITLPAGSPPRRGAPPAVNNVSRAGLALKQGEKLTGVAVTLAEGAASLRGKVVAEKEGERLPERMRAHLVPAEPGAADEALRYAEALVRDNGAFAFNNMAPGKYWLVTRVLPDDGPFNRPVTPLAWDANERAKLRREAMAAKNEIELQSCGRVKDYVLRFSH